MRWIRNSFVLIVAILILAWIASYYSMIHIRAVSSKLKTDVNCYVFYGNVNVTVHYGIQYTNQNCVFRFESPYEPPHEWYYIFGPVMLTGSGFDAKNPATIPPFKFWHSPVSTPSSHYRVTEIGFPLWLPTLLFALWPAIALFRHIKRRYFTQHICRQCGYDLRATPSGICPECGHEQTVTKTA